MDRVVLDANVVVAALLSKRGASHRLLRMVSEEGPFRVCLSVPLVLEYESALRRKLGKDHPSIDPVLDYLCKVGEHQEIFFLWRPHLQDPGDGSGSSGVRPATRGTSEAWKRDSEFES